MILERNEQNHGTIFLNRILEVGEMGCNVQETVQVFAYIFRNLS